MVEEIKQNDWKYEHPIFIFEGPDNSGKDTLISKLKAYIWNVSNKTTLEIHPKLEKGIDYKNYFLSETIETLLNLKKLEDRTIILNRFFHSEYVYGPIYRNYTPEFQEDNEKFLLSLDRPVILIYTYARPEILRTREDGLSLSSGNIEKIKKELELYENVINKSKLEVIRIDTSGCDPEKDFTFIIDSLSAIGVKVC